MKTKLTLALAASFLASIAGAQQAPKGGDHTSHHPAASASAAVTATPLSDGEVRRVDLAQGKLTLRHGPLANLDMPAMTMVFTVSSPKLLDGLKQGDKVRFTADKKDGVYVVTAIEVAR